MKHILKQAGGPTMAVGVPLVVLGLLLRGSDSGLPNCIVATSLSAGLVLIIFAAGRLAKQP